MGRQTVGVKQTGGVQTVKKTNVVQAVRQRGGECVGVLKARVKVVREEGEMVRQTGEEYYQEWEEEEKKKHLDRQAVAEVRGREAEEKLARNNWIQERIKREEVERKESVKLMEMLRTAKMMRKPKMKIMEVRSVATKMDTFNSDVEEEESEFREVLDDQNKLNNVEIVSSNFEIPSNVHWQSSCKSWQEGCGRVRSCEDDVRVDKQRMDEEDRKSVRKAAEMKRNLREQEMNLKAVEIRKKKEEEEESKKRKLEMKRRKEEQKHLAKLVSPLGPLDSTEEVSCLSTILEESEVQAIFPSLCDSVDLVRPARTTAEDSKESSVSPFMETKIVSRKVNETDITSVKQILNRVKMQGKVLEQSNTHFMTVEGRPRGKASKNPETAKPYKIDQQFVKRIMEFSSSSPFSSSGLSPSPPAKATFLPTPPPTTIQQPQLRYYIEKLLQLKHEDVQNLSVSVCQSGSSSDRETKAKTLKTSSLNLTSSSCSVRQTRAEDSQAIQSLYHTTRQQLLHKLSEVTAGSSNNGAQTLGWSSLELSSGGEGIDSSCGTVTSIQLSGSEFDTW